jgi:hypothetical protein
LLFAERISEPVVPVEDESVSSLVSSGTGVSLRTFMFAGVLAMSTMFTAMFSAASLVWDREFGFLREMLVAPVSRGAILIGKALGGTTVATIPGLGFLALAGAVGVPYDPLLLVALVVELLMLSFVLTAVGLVIAGRIRQIQSFMALTQLFLMPMLFLSGACSRCRTCLPGCTSSRGLTRSPTRSTRCAGRFRASGRPVPGRSAPEPGGHVGVVDGARRTSNCCWSFRWGRSCSPPPSGSSGGPSRGPDEGAIALHTARQGRPATSRDSGWREGPV